MFAQRTLVKGMLAGRNEGSSRRRWVKRTRETQRRDTDAARIERIVERRRSRKDLLMATVTFKDASRIYPKATRKAVNQLNLEIGDGEFVVLVGPSGCGKTTSLRMLAGLEPVDEGDILIDDRNVVRLPPRSATSRWCFRTTRCTRT